MNNLAGDSQRRRHSLSDWLALHDLDPATCSRILHAIKWEAAGEPASHESLNLGYEALDREVAWRRTAEAMREYLPVHKNIIADTFENTAKIVIDQPDQSRKALTLDNGPTAYPTILFSYFGEPSDCLVIAHEFAHALQIRASRGKFVPPVIREICAFIGESALLSYTLHCDAAQHTSLVQAWRNDNNTYFRLQRDRLQAALLRPHTSYQYSWNYPIARYLAVEISNRCSKDWVWSIFEGDTSLREVLRELSLSQS